MGSAPLNTRWSSIRLRRALLVRGSAVRRRPSRGVRCRGLRSRGAWARAPQPPQPPPVGAWAAARGRTAPGTGRPLKRAPSPAAMAPVSRRGRPLWSRAASSFGIVGVRGWDISVLPPQSLRRPIRGRQRRADTRTGPRVLRAARGGDENAPSSGRSRFGGSSGDFRGFLLGSGAAAGAVAAVDDQPPTSRTNPSTPSTPTTAATPPISTRGGRMRLNQPARGAASAPPMIRPRTTRP